MINKPNLVHLPEMSVDLEVGKVYIVAHDNPLIVTSYFVETIVSNYKKHDPIDNSAFIGLEYFIGDKYISLQRLRSTNILESNQIALAISIDHNSPDEFLEMLYQDVKANKNKIQYVLIDSFSDLIFKTMRGDVLINQVESLLSDIAKIAFEFQLPIILSTSIFYPVSRKREINTPLITKILKQIVKLNAHCIDTIAVKFSEPIKIFELDQSHKYVDLPMGYLIDETTNLFEPL